MTISTINVISYKGLYRHFLSKIFLHLSHIVIQILIGYLAGLSIVYAVEPSLTITNPAQGDIISGVVLVQADVQANTTPNSVTFYIDGSKALVDKSLPWEFNWDTTQESPGLHTIKVRAVKNGGGGYNMTQEISITVAGAPDDILPTVDVTNPSNGVDVSGIVTIAANASDNTSVTSVEFYIDSLLVGTDLDSPYEYAWDTSVASAGNHALAAKAYDAAGNEAIDDDTSVNVVIDTTPPTVDIITPLSGATVNDAVVVAATATDNVAIDQVEFFVDGVARSSDNSAPFEYTWDTSTESLGSHVLKAIALDTSGNQATDDDTAVTVEVTPPSGPYVQISPPEDGEYINNQSGTYLVKATIIADVPPSTVTFTIDGANVFTDRNAPWEYIWDPATVSEGTHTISVLAKKNGGGGYQLTDQVTVTTGADAGPPNVQVVAPVNGTFVDFGLVTVVATANDDTDIDRVEFYLDGALVSTDTEVPYEYSWDTSNLSAGGYDFMAIAYDLIGGEAIDDDTTLWIDNGQLTPPDPIAIAPQLDQSVSTSLYDAIKFIYESQPPIQQGIASGTVAPDKAALVRGAVLDASGAPLTSVLVTVRGHKELGRTRTREDGGFDLVVNGGAGFTLDFALDGYLAVQRRVDVMEQSTRVISDIRMLQVDDQANPVNFSGSGVMQVAKGSSVTDADGTRTATVLFPTGTSAMMELPDGSMQSLTNVTVRATEYTVGNIGPLAMPGDMSPTTAYTYAVELSIDEAMTAGAKTIHMSQPVPFYVENFLNYPVGGTVPAGYYDRDKAAWVPAPNGRVIKILSIANGLAELDVDGSGYTADSSELAALGVSVEERQTLATNYTAGQSLWRIPIDHFTPWDFNWPYGPPSGAKSPNSPKPDNKDEDKPCEKEGSIIECENQVLGERVSLTGTPFTLNYRSSRVQGYKASRELSIPITSDTLPPGVKRAELSIDVAGQNYVQTLSPTLNQSHLFLWDGKDSYDRFVQGPQQANIKLSYVYDAVLYEPDEFQNAFGSVGSGTIISSDRARQEISLASTYTEALGTLNAREQGLGGWSMNVHHTYDPGKHILYRGDGSKRSALALDRIADRLTGHSGYVDASGSNYFYSYENGVNYIFRRKPNGSVELIAGNGTDTYSGDGSYATQTGFKGYPNAITIGPDGSIYLLTSSRIYKINASGFVTHFAGNGVIGNSGDGNLATEAEIRGIYVIKVGPDGAIYFIQYNFYDESISYSHQIRRIGLDGIIRTVAGSGLESGSYQGDGIRAIDANLRDLRYFDFSADGGLIIAESGRYPQDSGNRVLKVNPSDGTLTTLAGNGTVSIEYDYTNTVGREDLSATSQAITPSNVAAAPDGGIYIFNIPVDPKYYSDQLPEIYHVTPEGQLSFVAGTSNSLYYSLPTNARRVLISGFVSREPSYFRVAANGDIYFGEAFDPTFSPYSDDHYRIHTGFPDVGFTDSVIPSEDGEEIYIFDATGRHLRTLNALTATVKYDFGYDTNGFLVSITDINNRVTTIERNAATANPTAIISPNGNRTTFGLDPNGYLASIANPANDTHSFTYSTDGLLLTATDPEQNTSTMTYDPQTGRLDSDVNAALGSWTTARSSIPNGNLSTMTTAEGRVYSYQTETVGSGGKQRTVTLPNGLSNIQIETPDGSTTTTLSDGTTISTQNAPDPRLGMFAPITESDSITLASGLSLDRTLTRDILLADPDDILSLTNLTDTWTSNGQTWIDTYDKASLSRTLTTPTGRQISRTFNVNDQLVSTQSMGGAPILISRDSQGRPETLSQGTGIDQRTFSATYDSNGFLATLTNEIGQLRTFSNDAAGRVNQVTYDDGSVLTFQLDKLGRTTSITPPGKSAHTLTYWPTGNLHRYTPPDIGIGNTSTEYTYDLDDNLTTILRPDGKTIGMVYDAAGRLANVTSPRGLFTYSYSSGNGKIATISTPETQSTSFTYDGPLLLSETWSGQINGSVSRTYNNNFNIASTTVAGSSIPFTYDNDGLLTQAGLMTMGRDVVTGLLTNTALGSITTTNSYTPFKYLEMMTASYGNSTIYNDAYIRDKTGRITGKTETIGVVTTNYTYEYDSANFLKEVWGNGVLVSSYTYDSNGNRLSVTTPTDTIYATYDSQDRLTGQGNASYAYSANGELQSKIEASDSTIYTYDVFGNLIKVILPEGMIIDYIIDGNNRRIGKKVDGQLTHGFLYLDQLNPIAELNANNQIVTRFIYAEKDHVPSYLIKIDPNTQAEITYRIISDHLGSPKLVINIADGSIVQRIDYDSWGNVTQDTNPEFQPFGFAGGLYDPHTNLIRFGVRDYDAETGRWMAKDPIGFAGGDSNLYGYVENDPVNFVDPLGFEALSPRDEYLKQRPRHFLDMLLNIPGIPSLILMCIDEWDDLFPDEKDRKKNRRRRNKERSDKPSDPKERDRRQRENEDQKRRTGRGGDDPTPTGDDW